MASTESTSRQQARRPFRRWLRFSLRTFLLVVTALCVWLGVKVDQARRQKRAVETLRALGAEIVYAHQRVDSGGFDSKIELDVPGWARELCGDDFFQTVTGVYFWPRLNAQGKRALPQPITDDDLKCLADLTHLEVLHIDTAPITDAGLSHLRHPERLRSVSLDNTDVGDGFIRRLKDSKLLKRLDLCETKVTDDALAELRITRLTVLRLGGTQTGDRALATFAERNLVALYPGRKTTDAGLRQFKTFSKVKFLLASDCQITGEAFRGFRLPTADSVYLENCAVSDVDLPPLVQAVKDVRLLLLDGCPITNSGLMHLKHLGKTQILSLSKTKIKGRELHHLASLSGLAILVLEGCSLDDPDLEALEPLYTGAAPGSNLTLDNTPITDNDLAQIAGFTNLQYMGLRDTKVTDAGLVHLHALKSLLRIDLRAARVTDEGVARLKRAIPKLQVAWDEDEQPAGGRPYR